MANRRRTASYRPSRFHCLFRRGLERHTIAMRAGQSLRVNVFVGGHPAMMLAAVMPLPEGMSELTFASI